MASLQKIRNHGALLITIVGVAMLAFILGDFLNSGSTFFNRSRENVAVVEGQDIHYTEYEAAQNQLTEVYKIETGRTNFDEEMTSQIRNQVWQMMLLDYTLRAQAEKIGMDITSDELSELCIGQNPHQLIRTRRAFYGQDGQFSRANLVQFLNSIEQEPEDAEQAANLQQAKSYWLYWENAVRLTYMQEKYTNLVQNLVRANSLDAKYAFEARSNSVDLQYVMQPYFTVADSLVSVSESDIKKLYKQHKLLYKQTPNRAIAYVSFPINPSESDFAEAEKMMQDLEQTFKTTDDIALVVNTNSDIPYDGRDYSKETVPAQYKDFAFSGKTGDVTGILFADNTYSMARIMQSGYSLPDSVELKAIALEGQEDQELGWFTADELPKDIAAKALAGKRGTRFSVTQGMNEQSFEIMDISPATPKVKLAILAREVVPSSKTYSVIYNSAKQFIVANTTEDAFRTAAAEAGMTVYPQYNLTATTEKVGNLTSSRPIVRWAFETKKEGQISDVFECGDRFVVAVLTEINDDEYRSLDAVRAELTLEATNNAKAKYITDKLAGAESLEAAAAITGTPVQSAEHVTLADYRLGNAGAEPAVLGYALSLGENTLSQPLQGNAGVYMLKTGAKAADGAEFNAEQEKMNLATRYSYSLPYQAISLMEDKAKVEDNRANFQ